MNPRVSVVVPTFRRPDLLDRCLAALAGQDLDPGAYEVIVADDAASPDTRQQVETWAERHSVEGNPSLARTGPPRLRYVAVKHAHGPAAARNAGWRESRGEIIAFTDDDCVPDRGWLRAGLAAFHPGVVGVQGEVAVPVPSCPTDYERDAAGLSRGEFVTANCFYRRDALVAIGGLDERFRVAWREDTDLFFTVLERLEGATRPGALARAPGAIVVHPIRPAPWGVSLQQQRKSMFNALLYKKHPLLYRRRIQPAPPRLYYLAVGMLLGGVGLALGGQPRFALGAVGAWALLTGRFCTLRLRGTSRAPGHVGEMIVTSALIPPLAVLWRLAGAIKFRVPFL